MCVIIVCFLSGTATIAYASSPQSPNYRFDESVIGSGGLIQSSSPNYQVGVSLGDTAIGNSASTNYQVNAGSKTTNDPALSLTVNNGTANFGSFTPVSYTHLTLPTNREV